MKSTTLNIEFITQSLSELLNSIPEDGHRTIDWNTLNEQRKTALWIVDQLLQAASPAESMNGEQMVFGCCTPRDPAEHQPLPSFGCTPRDPAEHYPEVNSDPSIIWH